MAEGNFHKGVNDLMVFDLYGGKTASVAGFGIME